MKRSGLSQARARCERAQTAPSSALAQRLTTLIFDPVQFVGSAPPSTRCAEISRDAEQSSRYEHAEQPASIHSTGEGGARRRDIP